MNISPHFYLKQNQWTGIYTRPKECHDQERADWLSDFWGSTPKKILEIGCGGGQFAAACAGLGHIVTAIDLEKKFIEYAKQNANPVLKENLYYIQDNFYTYKPDTLFDIVCYLDGFGVGSDDEQIGLLNNIFNWLKPEGFLFLEVYSPWYWSKQNQQTPQNFGPFKRQYGYDPYQNRMTDTWWQEDQPKNKIFQSLRCYTPADLNLLLSSTGFYLEEIIPGGGFDPISGEYTQQVPLIHAMSFFAKISKK